MVMTFSGGRSSVSRATRRSISGADTGSSSAVASRQAGGPSLASLLDAPPHVGVGHVQADAREDPLDLLQVLRPRFLVAPLLDAQAHRQFAALRVGVAEH